MLPQYALALFFAQHDEADDRMDIKKLFCIKMPIFKPQKTACRA
jgi:hypothetical protein